MGEPSGLRFGKSGSVSAFPTTEMRSESIPFSIMDRAMRAARVADRSQLESITGVWIGLSSVVIVRNLF